MKSLAIQACPYTLTSDAADTGHVLRGTGFEGTVCAGKERKLWPRSTADAPCVVCELWCGSAWVVVAVALVALALVKTLLLLVVCWLRAYQFVAVPGQVQVRSHACKQQQPGKAAARRVHAARFVAACSHEHTTLPPLQRHEHAHARVLLRLFIRSCIPCVSSCSSGDRACVLRA